MPHAELLGDYLGAPDAVIHSPGNVQRPRLQPNDPDLARRIRYGGGSLHSVRWAAENGLALLSGNIVTGENTDDFTTAQLNLLAEYHRTRSGDRPARVALGRVIVPLDSADAASRHERTLAPQGPKRTLFAPDVVGTAEQILHDVRHLVAPELGRQPAAPAHSSVRVVRSGPRS
ncbi:hypothetical protein QF037_008639 [Streptomyces canus]|uniref:hypothetical protein n=1 Tax=Streptomyces canus TaxID=58343 RepID=UPI002783F113|nr:hypothetical protein [Streptomyces canus]MDQ0604294.1 hypothetical protein [Streptomyces canus]